MFSQELRLPPFDLSRFLEHSSELARDKAQLGVFFDYASLRQVAPIPDVHNTINLASAGFLARYSISRFVDIEFDLGWRLRETPTVPVRASYGQISLTGSF